MDRQYCLGEADLSRILQGYRRWVQEGKPPHGGQFDVQQRKPQYYYDSYHEALAECGDGTFTFNVQTFDSPDGDTWVRGKFKIGEGGIVIIEQSAYGN